MNIGVEGELGGFEAIGKSGTASDFVQNRVAVAPTESTRTIKVR